MKIAILGFGNVGQGVEEIIYKNKEKIRKILGEDLRVKKALIKNFDKKRNYFDKDIIFTDKVEDILDDEEIGAVVELTGSLDDAFIYASEAMKKHKAFITANKVLVSAHFYELYELALENKVGFFYEASVGGGVHLIKSILEDLPLNKLTETEGILNGTCNFILSAMQNKALSFDQALGLAQELGFAEKDPSADIKGLDGLRKLHILSSLMFETRIKPEQIFLEGIEKVRDFDVANISKKGLRLKHLGRAERCEDYSGAYLMPVGIGKDSIFYTIENEVNMISYQGENIGKVIFAGKGAGRLPTADAVLRDVMDWAKGDFSTYNPLGQEEICLRWKFLEGEFYLRLPKNKGYLLEGLGDEIISNQDYQAVFTQKIKLVEVIRLVEKSGTDDYFFALLRK